MTTVNDADALFDLLSQRNQEGHTPTVVGFDRDGEPFLAYLAGIDGDRAGFVADDPRATEYSVAGVGRCEGCGSFEERGIDALLYPVSVASPPTHASEGGTKTSCLCDGASCFTAKQNATRHPFIVNDGCPVHAAAEATEAETMQHRATWEPTTDPALLAARANSIVAWMVKLGGYAWYEPEQHAAPGYPDPDQWVPARIAITGPDGLVYMVPGDEAFKGERFPVERMKRGMVPVVSGWAREFILRHPQTEQTEPERMRWDGTTSAALVVCAWIESLDGAATHEPQFGQTVPCCDCDETPCRHSARIVIAGPYGDRTVRPGDEVVKSERWFYRYKELADEANVPLREFVVERKTP